MTDILRVGYDKDNKERDKSGLCVARYNADGSCTVLKMVLDKKADDLYRLLTRQEEKVKESQEVIYQGDGYYDGEIVYDFANCPRCGFGYEESDLIWGLPFCPKCGQALKWEVEDEERSDEE